MFEVKMNHVQDRSHITYLVDRIKKRQRLLALEEEAKQHNKNKPKRMNPNDK